MSDRSITSTAPAPRPGGWTWRRLLALCGLIEASLLVVVAGWLGDAEAAVVGALLVLGTALLRWRSGLLGVLLVTVMLGNVAFWMTAGVVSNLAADELFVDRAVPATLTVLALTGLLAGLVQLVRRNRPGGSPGAVGAVGVLGAAGLVGLLVLSLVGAGGDGVTGADVELASAGLAFEPEELSVDAGEVTDSPIAVKPLVARCRDGV